YSRVDMVNTPGDFSVRGGIIDLYPLTEENPVRIELFDAEIDSIRTFSIDDQRSIEKRDFVTIGPVSEMQITSEMYGKITKSLEQGLAHSLKKLKQAQAKDKMIENIGFDLEKLRNEQGLENMFKYISLAYDQPASLLDYLSSSDVLIFDEMSRIQEMNERLEREESEWYVSLLEQGQIVHDIHVSHSLNTILNQSGLQRIYVSLFMKQIAHTQPQNIVNVTSK